ncbi:MAG: hypothetical protein JWM95_1797 [Gemmatimonadetes bacterium]|nr:hypothetical protein [Gemmatimonadota bacterium]
MRRSINALTLTVAFALLLAARPAPGQSYDPARNDPLSLAAGPSDPISYFHTRRQVADWLNQRKDSLAEPVAKKLTETYPRDGVNWVYFAFAAHNLKHYRASAAAYEQAGALLGWSAPHFAGINAARNWVAAGDTAAALRMIRFTIVDQHDTYRTNFYDDSAFAALRPSPEFQRLTGHVDVSKLSRIAGWQYDIDYLSGEVARVAPDYRAAPLPTEFVRRRDALKRSVPKLMDEQILVEINRMLATLHQGHTGMWSVAPGSRLRLTKLPLQLYAFPDGIFVVDASEKHRDLIGARLVSIEKTQAERALARVNELQSVDGDMEYLQGGALMLAEVQVLRGLGIMYSDTTVSVGLQMRDGRHEERSLSVEPITGREKLPPPPSVPTPLYLTRLESNYWAEPLPDHDALYVQLNQMQSDKGEALPAFGARVRAMLVDSRARNVIVDVRHNDGGLAQLYTPLLRALTEFSMAPGHQIYLLTSRTTYSAAGLFATDMELLTKPIFVGEPPGDCCNIHGTAPTVILPFSKLRGRVSAMRYNRSDPWDQRREISPGVPVFLTAADYFAGRDAALETTFRLIAERPKDKSP